MDVVDFALQVISLARENDSLRARVKELEEFKEMYYSLLASSGQHSSAMMGQLVGVLSTPGVMEACNNALANPAERQSDER